MIVCVCLCIVACAYFMALKSHIAVVCTYYVIVYANFMVVYFARTVRLCARVHLNVRCITITNCFLKFRILTAEKYDISCFR